MHTSEIAVEASFGSIHSLSSKNLPWMEKVRLVLWVFRLEEMVIMVELTDTSTRRLQLNTVVELRFMFAAAWGVLSKLKATTSNWLRPRFLSIRFIIFRCDICVCTPEYEVVDAQDKSLGHMKHNCIGIFFPNCRNLSVTTFNRPQTYVV